MVPVDKFDSPAHPDPFDIPDIVMTYESPWSGLPIRALVRIRAQEGEVLQIKEQF